MQVRGPTGKFFRLEYDSQTTIWGNVGIALEIGRYPAPGNTEFPVQAEDANRTGTYWAVLLRKSWSWYGGHLPPPTWYGDDEVALSDEQASEPGAGSSSDPSTHVWADTVRAYSSQYGAERWAATQVLGPPDVYPRHGDIERAWASRQPDSATEFIEVGYYRPRPVAGVAIYETYNPGAIDRVELITTGAHRIRLSQPTVNQTTSSAPDQPVLDRVHQRAGSRRAGHPGLRARPRLERDRRDRHGAVHLGRPNRHPDRRARGGANAV